MKKNANDMMDYHLWTLVATLSIFIILWTSLSLSTISHPNVTQFIVTSISHQCDSIINKLSYSCHQYNTSNILSCVLGSANGPNASSFAILVAGISSSPLSLFFLLIELNLCLSSMLSSSVCFHESQSAFYCNSFPFHGLFLFNKHHFILESLLYPNFLNSTFSFCFCFISSRRFLSFSSSICFSYNNATT